MPETLWLVIIGGLIGVSGGVATTILSLIYNHYHWKKENKLEHLKAERRQKKEQYLSTLSKLEDCINRSGDWNWYMVTRLRLVLRNDENIVSVLQEMANPQIARRVIREEYKQIGLSMEKSLDEIDKKINELMS